MNVVDLFNKQAFGIDDFQDMLHLNHYSGRKKASELLADDFVNQVR